MVCEVPVQTQAEGQKDIFWRFIFHGSFVFKYSQTVEWSENAFLFVVRPDGCVDLNNCV